MVDATSGTPRDFGNWRLTYRSIEIDIERLDELDQDCWFGVSSLPTIREVANHCRRINDANLDHPVIINANGLLMDGGHRIALALLEGRTAIRAVRFEDMPPPDEIRDL